MPGIASSSAAPIRQRQLLKPYTTFKIGGPAAYWVEVGSADSLLEALAFRKVEDLDLFILGGGSNILVSDRGFDGLVVHPVNRGICVSGEDADTVALRIGAAESWDDTVAYAVADGLWGIENLSHIPGQTGAALVQNIGAYGAQLSDVFVSAEVMAIETGEIQVLDREACRLGYRTSIFNTTSRGRLVTLSLTLRLKKRGEPNLGYPDLRAYFQEWSSKPIGSARPPGLAEIRQAIVTIRDRKFPFPREEKGGNAGSFFKNLLLTETEYLQLEEQFQRHFGPGELDRLRELRNRFPAAGQIRIPTAFLIEICGLKGCRIGGAQVNETQPLVLLNQGGATAHDVLTLAHHVRQTIYAKTGMAIEIEPELVGFTPAELADYLSLS